MVPAAQFAFRHGRFEDGVDVVSQSFQADRSSHPRRIRLLDLLDKLVVNDRAEACMGVEPGAIGVRRLQEPLADLVSKLFRNRIRLGSLKFAWA